MACDTCLIKDHTRSDIYDFLCDQCREGDPCSYLLEVAYDNSNFTPFTFAADTHAFVDAMNAFRTRNLEFRLLQWESGNYQLAPLTEAA